MAETTARAYNGPMNAPSTPQLVVSVFAPDGSLAGRASGQRGALVLEPGASDQAASLLAHLAALPVRCRRPC